jgi:small subunit ribosomal protein S8
MFNDPIANFILRINNANRAKHTNVIVPISNLIIDVLTVLKDEGYINKFEVVEENKIRKANVELKYVDHSPAITGIKQISKPGLRIYHETKTLPKVLSGLGVAIVSTSKGVMTAKLAKKNNVGGEVIAYVW